MKTCTIKEFRDHLGLSQIDFANLIGCQQANISCWEIKNTIPKTKHYLRMVEIAKLNKVEIMLN